MIGRGAACADQARLAPGAGDADGAQRASDKLIDYIEAFARATVATDA